MRNGGSQEKRTVLQTRIPPAAYEKVHLPKAKWHFLIAPKVADWVIDPHLQANRVF